MQFFRKALAISSKTDFNIFSLGDALGKRDRKNLWILYEKAIASGISPEEIHGTLFWQVKSMILSKSAKDAEEAVLKPYVFKKSNSYAKNFTSEELFAISSKLVDIYHEARRGVHDFGIALELFILQV